VRGGGDEQIRALGRAPAAAVGPLVAVRASEDTPELIEPV